ncbi:MAG: 16S rRNA (cytosine(1402)-N(4))-methyltransferase RsmH [Acidobacteriota bacterium]
MQLHRPVLLEEVVELLKSRDGGIYVDCTVGLGGHSEKILTVAAPEGSVIGIEIDAESLALAEKNLSRFGKHFIKVRNNYKKLPGILDSLGIDAVDGILVDLGMSSYHVTQSSRGFSFQIDGPLDMRFDTDQEETAEKLVNELPEENLQRILEEYGEEKFGGKIARLIVARRREKRIERTSELSRIVLEACGQRRSKIHPATKTFQALRIAVNRELEGLSDFIRRAIERLKKGGRMAIISYHSLEDRIVKMSFRDLSSSCICPPALPVCGCGRETLVRLITRKPILPSRKELLENPRARSARLRVVERL